MNKKLNGSKASPALAISFSPSIGNTKNSSNNTMTINESNLELKDKSRNSGDMLF